MIKDDKNSTKTIDDIIDSLKEDYLFNYYLPNYTPVQGTILSNQKKYIKDTISTYKKYHEEFNEKKVIPLYEYFYNLAKSDTLIYFDNKIIYKELYKILYFINNTLQIQNLLNNSKKYPCDFAKIQTDLKKVNTFRFHNKKNVIGEMKQRNKKESRLKYWLFTLYVKNREITKFFLFLPLLLDIEKIVSLISMDEEDIEVFLSVYQWFIIQNTTIPKVIKSLGILLYFEQIYYLKISKDKAKINAEAIIYDLFKESLNTEEFDKNIYLQSSVSFPIFGASKENKFNDSERKFLKQQIQKELKQFIQIDNNILDEYFNIFMKNPHSIFLEKYPVELLRINPKYSS